MPSCDIVLLDTHVIIVIIVVVIIIIIIIIIYGYKYTTKPTRTSSEPFTATMNST